MAWFRDHGLLAEKVNPAVEEKCNLFLFQREVHKPTEAEVRTAAERAWGCRFPGDPNSWFVHGGGGGLIEMSTVRIGRQTVYVDCQTGAQYDEDKATDQLPPLALRAEWPPYASRLSFSFAWTPLPVPTAIRVAYVARLAREFFSSNILGVYHSFPRRYVPTGEQAMKELEGLAFACPAESSGVAL